LRVLALDPGTRRIGVAVSDELGLLARPVAVVERTSRAADLARLAALVDELRPSEIVVGLPLLPSGDRGPQAEQSERFAELVGATLGLPVRLWNESYSTVEAHRRRSHRRRRNSSNVDAEAAAVFLQDYLDARRPVVRSSNP
jgi:putative Holliday junction resolvase